jgi:hypothetical protein
MKYMGNVRSIIWQEVWIVVKRPIGALACHYKGAKEYHGSAVRKDFETSFATANQVKRAELSLLCILIRCARIVAKSA